MAYAIGNYPTFEDPAVIIVYWQNNFSRQKVSVRGNIFKGQTALKDDS
jgi:hypothetical protein